MSLTSILNSIKSLITPNNLQTQFFRHGHQMCTRNPSGRSKNKRRGIKRGQYATVNVGDILVTQRTLKFHPGMNVTITDDCSLKALVPGRVHISCEKFNPNFNNKWVTQFYEGREGQQIYKKYLNVIPFPLKNRFSLVEVV